MSLSENNHNNDEWRKIFEEASVNPPPNVWDAIEQRLDEKQLKPLVTPWWQKNWLAAASVLVVLGVGTIAYLTQDTPAGDQVASSGQVENVVSSQPQVQGPSVAAVESLNTTSTGSEKSISGRDNTVRKENTLTLAAAPEQSATLRTARSGTQAGTAAAARVNLASVEEDAPDTRMLLAGLQTIEPAEVGELKTYWQTRYMFFNPDANRIFEEEKTDLETSPMWAAVSFMPGGFNPNMDFSHQSVYQMNYSLTQGNGNFEGLDAASVSRTSTAKRDQARLSFQAAAQVGWNLSRNWSIESGISYLQGNSTSRSPGFYVNKMTQESADLLPNAMASGNAKYSPDILENLQLARSLEGYSTVYVPMDKNMSNNYQFLQIPVMAGYTLQPEKKLSYTMLAGGVTNFFLKNELETSSGFVLETKPENNVYNTLSVAASAGLRVNYRINSNWFTTLTGNYQHAITDAFKENQFLKSKPQVYGISWGIRYTIPN